MLAWLVSFAFAPALPWSHLAASPSGALAIAHPHEVRLSTDRGASFRSALFAVENLDGIALADDGTLYAARQGRLGRRDPDGAEVWTVLPGESTQTLLANGPYLVWLGLVDRDARETWWVSVDRGRTFAPRPEWETGSYGNTAALGASGRVHLVIGWEAACGGGHQERFVGHVAQTILRNTGWPLDSPVDYTPTTRGWVYVPDDCGDFDKYVLCAVSPGGVVNPLAVPFDDDDYDPVFVAEDGARAWLLHHGRLTRAIGHDARTLSNAAPRNARALAATRGAPWVLTDEGRLLSFSGKRWIDKTP